jgi:hypothetical protein
MYTTIQEFQYVKQLEAIAKIAEAKRPIAKLKIKAKDIKLKIHDC